MEKFTTLSAVACPLGLANVDTDQILPARFLKIARADGLGRHLLHDLRRDEAGNERPGFPLNEPQWREAKILVAGRNFGGGSSREAAVYAIYDSGIRCVIAPSFGDIFSENATKNGLLTAIVSQADADAMTAALLREPERAMTVDLERQTIAHAGASYPFAIDPSRRERLLKGLDDIGLTMGYADQITAFRTRDRALRGWKYLS